MGAAAGGLLQPKVFLQRSFCRPTASAGVFHIAPFNRWLAWANQGSLHFSLQHHSRPERLGARTFSPLSPHPRAQTCLNSTYPPANKWIAVSFQLILSHSFLRRSGGRGERKGRRWCWALPSSVIA